MDVDVIADPAGPADEAAIVRLLAASDLPTDGVRDALGGFVVVREDGEIVAVAGLEWYGAAVLLRSVVVAAPVRGRGLGARLVAERLATAARSGAADAYLLTTTAEAFFRRLDFAEIDRAAVPDGVRDSAEFTSLCPQSATAMHRRIVDLA